MASPTPPYKPGEEIQEGRIYRRIKADPADFDTESRKPTYLAFRPRSQDGGAISAHLKDYVSVDAAATDPRNPNDKTYGLCEIDIAKARGATGGRFVVQYAPTRGFIGDAHVRVLGCDDVDTQIKIAELAGVVRAPTFRPPR